jgi:hypothetical protein
VNNLERSEKRREGKRRNRRRGEKIGEVRGKERGKLLTVPIESSFLKGPPYGEVLLCCRNISILII